MQFQPQLRIPATYMRGGTSKGIFFHLDDLPIDAQVPGKARDNLLLRVLGSPDAYAKQTDGMGSATSSTSKVVIVSKSKTKSHDIDYLFGQVSIDKPLIDWSGNCGNLSAAVGSFAIFKRLINTDKIPENGSASLRIWQVNTQKTILANIPINNFEVQETGNFKLDGVTFPAAQIKLEYLDPNINGDTIFPTGNVIDDLVIPTLGYFKVTLINAGIPTIFINAEALDYEGTEGQEAINNNKESLERFEILRAHGALKMGLITKLSEIQTRQHTPKIAFVSPPKSYITSSGKQIKKSDTQLLVRALSMGKLHHAIMGTASIAIASAAVVPGTVVNQAAGSGKFSSIRFGHPSGVMIASAVAKQVNGSWKITKASLESSARILMDGKIHIPQT